MKSQIAAETKQRILVSANKIIAENGLDQFTLEAVAKDAGVTKGGLFYHFPTKDSLLESLIQASIDIFECELQDKLNSEPQRSGRFTRAYLKTCFSPSQKVSFNAGMLAAIASKPQLMAPIIEADKEWQRQMENDGIEPALAVALKLCGDGMWFDEFFGIQPMNHKLKPKILKTVLDLI
jgi:AcrR family transcriptional regulator